MRQLEREIAGYRGNEVGNSVGVGLQLGRMERDHYRRRIKDKRQITPTLLTKPPEISFFKLVFLKKENWNLGK